MGDLRNRVMQVISYNPVSGEFRNLIRRSNALAGDISGNIGPNGYLTIMIDYRSYYAHHLARSFTVIYEIPTKSTAKPDHLVCKQLLFSVEYRGTANQVIRGLSCLCQN